MGKNSNHQDEALEQTTGSSISNDAKRGGWKWHQTKMTDPERAERHWKRDRFSYFMAS